MKLFGVIYLKSFMAATMLMPPSFTVKDCEIINTRYSRILDDLWKRRDLDHDPKMILPDTHERLHRQDVHLTCEYHETDPLKNGGHYE